jgi:hypothetical protein
VPVYGRVAVTDDGTVIPLLGIRAVVACDVVAARVVDVPLNVLPKGTTVRIIARR